MLRLVSLTLCAVALASPALGSAPERVLIARNAAVGASYAQLGPAEPVMPVTMSLRGGIMTAPRGAGLAGIDIAVPSVSLLDGWEGRLDADVIFKANLADISTVVPVTLNQVRYSQDVSGRSVYFGAGAGALLGGKAKLIGKALLGVEVSARLAVEGNVIITDDKTMITVLGRLHL
ncbi:MAG: hypothetical protein FJX72_03775 [Armatimonadetes bacterium]|nr:hypothetical protein [Armatimonadota bacterium]